MEENKRKLVLHLGRASTALALGVYLSGCSHISIGPVRLSVYHEESTIKKENQNTAR